MIVDHEYSGGGQLVTQSYPEPGIDRTLALGSGSDPYSALDRFGRMIDLRWTKSATEFVSFELSALNTEWKHDYMKLVGG